MYNLTGIHLVTLTFQHACTFPTYDNAVRFCSLRQSKSPYLSVFFVFFFHFHISNVHTFLWKWSEIHSLNRLLWQFTGRTYPNTYTVCDVHICFSIHAIKCWSGTKDSKSVYRITFKHPAFLHRRHREKLQAHFSDGRSLRDCSVNASGLMSKSAPRLQYSLQFQKVQPLPIVDLFPVILLPSLWSVSSSYICNTYSKNRALDRMMYDVYLNNLYTGFILKLFVPTHIWHKLRDSVWIIV